MVLVVLILCLCSLVPLHTWDILEDDRYDILEKWGYSRLKRARSRLEERFSTIEYITCGDMHKTRKTAFVSILLYKTSGRYLCMASIVDHYHILSATVCFEKAAIHELLVLSGYYKPYWGKDSQVKKVDRVIRSESMIALARLKSPLRYTEYVKPMKFPPSFTKQDPQFENVFPPPYKVIGMNVDTYDIPGEYISKDTIYELKEDDFVPFDECKKDYSKYILEEDKLFCTGGNSTFCWGGLGGPVVKWMKESYYLQIGVVVAENCTFQSMTPFLVARTDALSDWITSNSFHEKKPR